MQRLLSYTTLALLIWLLSGCYEDSIKDGERITTVSDPLRVYINKVSGTALDVLKQPIANVRIQVGDQQTLTDSEGHFVLEDVPFSEDVSGIYLAASKNGYYKTGVRLYPNTQHSIETSITLVPTGEIYRHANSAGAIIHHPNGVTISAPADAFLKNGNTHNGDVLINIYWVDPNDLRAYQHKIQVYEARVGDDGEISSPQFISMAHIIATDEGGVPLDVRLETPLKVTFPVQYDAAAEPEVNMQEQATLLSIDEQAGLWIDKGVAQRLNDGYSAELDNISWWAVANLNASTNLCLTFENISTPDGHFYSVQTTSGNLIYASPMVYGAESCIPVPSGQPLIIKVYNECFVPISEFNFAGSDDPRTSIAYQVEDGGTRTLSIKILDCEGQEYPDSVEVRYSTDRSMDVLGIRQGEFDLVLGSCFEQSEVYISLYTIDGALLSTQEISLHTRPTYHTVAICTRTSAGSSRFGDELFDNTIGRKNKEETLIIANADDASSPLIGFDGFSTGTYTARVLFRGEVCDGTVSITKYEEVGGLIEGTYSVIAAEYLCKESSGVFSARREK